MTRRGSDDLEMSTSIIEDEMRTDWADEKAREIAHKYLIGAGGEPAIAAALREAEARGRAEREAIDSGVAEVEAAKQRGSVKTRSFSEFKTEVGQAILKQGYEACLSQLSNPSEALIEAVAERLSGAPGNFEYLNDNEANVYRDDAETALKALAAALQSQMQQNPAKEQGGPLDDEVNRQLQQLAQWRHRLENPDWALIEVVRDTLPSLTYESDCRKVLIAVAAALQSQMQHSAEDGG